MALKWPVTRPATFYKMPMRAARRCKAAATERQSTLSGGPTPPMGTINDYTASRTGYSETARLGGGHPQPIHQPDERQCANEACGEW